MKGWALLLSAWAAGWWGCASPIGALCQQTEECGELSRCALHACRYACPCLPEETCVEGACYPTQCEAPCAEGEVCVDGRCADPRCGAHSCHPFKCDPVRGICIPPASWRTDCTEVVEVSCGDGQDNDCDGASDCQDRDCGGAICRPSLDVCDLPERCLELGECPPDVSAPAGTVCRDETNGACDAPEVCDGFNPTCPTANRVKPPNAVCRPAQGPCDMAEVCDGGSSECPPDTRHPSTRLCRLSSGAPCDLDDYCAGDIFCPDQFASAGTVCHPSVGGCDQEDRCSGLSPNCPDTLKDAGTVCRPAVGACDLPETCLGNDPICPSDRFWPSGHLCRSPVDCVPGASCTGTSASCPAPPNTDGQSCPGYNHQCCGGACIDPATDKQNCGSCGHLCPGTSCCAGSFCVGGFCP